jgi:hypothetical protein
MVKDVLPLSNMMIAACLSHSCWGKFVQAILV